MRHWKVDAIIAASHETNREIHVNNDTPEDVKNKCEKCDFIAKNEQGLKIHKQNTLSRKF